MNLIVVDQPGYEEGLPDLTDGVSLPVLQDTTEDAMVKDYAASQWYLYLIDRSGTVRTVWYNLDLGDDADRLLAGIAALEAEE